MTRLSDIHWRWLGVILDEVGITFDSTNENLDVLARRLDLAGAPA